MIEFYYLMLGVIYGLIIGIIPAAGATTGLIAVFGFLSYFPDPYLAVIFVMAVVAASTTGDTYSGVLLGIPGADSAAATMVDGFPLAQQGKAAYALSAAVTTSTINGLLWGAITFFLFPYYGKLMMYFGIPEMWAFIVVAMTTVAFVSSVFWFRSMIALAFGVWLGMIGMDPITGDDRFTFGWGYLADHIQLMPIVAGLFAMPELLDGLKQRASTTTLKADYYQQTIDGMKAVWTNRWLSLRGGIIGAVIGFLPGLGGAMSDWMSYGSAVASTKNPDVPFGKGNIRGVIGPEGSNNAQKATAMIPTVLFGIPGASFAAIVMALFAYLDFELGSPQLLLDTKFFESMSYGFMLGTLIVGIIAYFATRYIAMITSIPYKYYFPLLLSFIVWACVQYTGGWEDYVMLTIFTVIGLLAKKFKFSRPALLIGFILANKFELLSIQLFTIYKINDIITRPIFVGLLLITGILLLWSIKNKSKLEYS